MSRYTIKPGKPGKPGGHVRLKDFDPDYTDDFEKGPAVETRLRADLERLAKLQERLYAEHQRAILIILQGMDTSGKDGTIKHVFSGVNPTGCQVTSFKQPSSEELDHDFLWRIHCAAPRKGTIGIFNRSHYEDVLVVRVHKLVPKSEWKTRYDRINAFERSLVESGTTILKFFLHISKDEQKRRLEERLSDPEKNWKFADQDVKERRLWDDYQEAYEDALSRCSTEWAQWTIVPANQKWYRNLVVARAIVKTLAKMNPRPPRLSIDLTKVKIV